MLLTEVARVLEVYGAKVDLYLAASSSVDAFRQVAVRSLSEPGHHVVVNYSRSLLGQEGAGHTSPVGAYDADTDRFLVLDVARYRSPTVWITSDHLFAAMAAPKSPASSQSRGFLLISKRVEPNGQQDQFVTLR